MREAVKKLEEEIVSLENAIKTENEKSEKSKKEAKQNNKLLNNTNSRKSDADELQPGHSQDDEKADNSEND